MTSEISTSQILRFVWSYYRRMPFLVASVYFFLTVTILLEVANPMVMGWLTDSVSRTGALTEIHFREALFFVFLLFGQGVLFHATYRAAHFINCIVDSRVQKMVAAETLDRVQRFAMDWHTNSFAGSTVTKIKRGMRAIHTFYDVISYNLYRTIGITLVMIVVISTRHLFLGLFFGAFSFLYAIYSIVLATKYVTPQNRRANKEDNKIGAALADTLSSNMTVKSFSGEDRERNYFEKVSTEWMYTVRKAWIRSNIVALSQSIIINLLKLSVMLMAVWLWYDGKFTVGDVVFVFTSYQVFSGNLGELGNRVQDINQAVNDMEDVVRFWETPMESIHSAKTEKLQVSQGNIEFQNITFSYPGHSIPVYENFSLTIAPGEKVALVGHSGSGKTTFVKLLQRLYEVNEGSIAIDGQNISHVTQESLRQSIALVPQDPILFHRSLAENIAYGKPDASQAEVEKASRLAHAHEFIAALPRKYETLVGERGIKLSGGERQRVAIARAILANAPIIVLDEATSSLDSISEKYIQDALKYLLKGKTTIIIAHRLSTIKKADRILVFEKGEVVEEGTHAVLLRKKDGIYRELYEMQAGGFIGE